MSITNTIENFFVTAFNYFPKKEYMVMGDEFGNIKIWSCKRLMLFMDLLRKSNHDISDAWMKKDEFYLTVRYVPGHPRPI